MATLARAQVDVVVGPGDVRVDQVRYGRYYRPNVERYYTYRPYRYSSYPYRYNYYRPYRYDTYRPYYYDEYYTPGPRAYFYYGW